jgi:hypothetical protein
MIEYLNKMKNSLIKEDLDNLVNLKIGNNRFESFGGATNFFRQDVVTYVSYCFQNGKDKELNMLFQISAVTPNFFSSKNTKIFDRKSKLFIDMITRNTTVEIFNVLCMHGVYPRDKIGDSSSRVKALRTGSTEKEIYRHGYNRAYRMFLCGATISKNEIVINHLKRNGINLNKIEIRFIKSKLTQELIDRFKNLLREPEISSGAGSSCGAEISQRSCLSKGIDTSISKVCGSSMDQEKEFLITN